MSKPAMRLVDASPRTAEREALAAAIERRDAAAIRLARLRRSEIAERLTFENVAVQKNLKQSTVKTTSEREMTQRVNQE